MFQRKQIEPLWLPGHKVAYDLSKPEDEAAAFIGADGLQSRIEEASAGTSELDAKGGRLFHPNADELFEDDGEPQLKPDVDPAASEATKETGSTATIHKKAE